MTIPPEAITDPNSHGNPVLFAAAEAIIQRHLRTHHHSGDQESARAALAIHALEDATAALDAAAQLLRAEGAAAERDRIASRIVSNANELLETIRFAIVHEGASVAEVADLLRGGP